MKRKMRLFRKFKSIKSEASLESYRKPETNTSMLWTRLRMTGRKSLTDSLVDSKNTRVGGPIDWREIFMKANANKLTSRI